MKKMFFAAGALALALASCGGGSDCTTEVLQKKSVEMQDALKTLLTKDPSKATDVMQKIQEMSQKIQAAGDKPTAETCKAVDDFIASIKS